MPPSGPLFTPLESPVACNAGKKYSFPSEHGVNALCDSSRLKVEKFLTGRSQNAEEAALDLLMEQF